MMKKIFTKVNAVAFVVSMIVAGSSTAAFGLWSDTGKTGSVAILEANVYASVNGVESTGTPSVSLVRESDNARDNFWQAPLSEVRGENVQATGVAHWEFPAYVFSPNKDLNIANLKEISSLYMGVKVDDNSPWKDAKFKLIPGACGSQPSFDDARGLTSEGTQGLLEYRRKNTHNMLNDNEDLSADFGTDMCLWAKLLEDKRQVYTVSGAGDSAMTQGLYTEENKTGSKSGYHNDVNAEGQGFYTKNNVTSNDSWDVLFERYPNPKDGDVSILFRPAFTSGICEVNL